MSATPVLLVSTTTRWMGTARVPRALARAGFEVALLTPRNALAEKSRYVSRVGYLPDNATVPQWVFAFAATVKATSPRLVIPCDDLAFRLLRMLVVAPPQGMQPELQMRLATLVRGSLGDPEHYAESVDKTLLPPAAQALGVPVPDYEVVGEPAQAEAFAARHGYPVVLKRAHGFAGQGVAVCADREALERAFAEFSRANAADLRDGLAGRHLVQAHVPGRVTVYIATAWEGELLAGWAGEKVVAHPEPTGPPTVGRHFRSPRLRELTASLARGFGISGHFFAEYIVAEGTGEPYLLEINRRITPASHRGAARNVDQWAALHARLNGTVSPSRADLDEGEEGITVFFPDEWLRDPESRWLRECPVDAPWDEPELFEAMLALRRER